MSTPGWYPDPGGRSGHFRFWDGRAWAPTTTTQIPDGPPPPGSGRPPRPPRRWRLGPVVGLAAALVAVLVVVGVLVLRPGGTPAAGPGPADPSTTDAAPPPSAQPSPTTPPSSPSSPSSPNSPSSEPSAAQCPVGDPTARQDHPDDGRVHGGGISIPGQQGWADPGDQQTSFTWAYDVGEIDTKVQPQWYVAYAVGALSVADGFEDPRSAAELSMQCTLGSSFYRNVVGRPALVERRTTVQGYPAFTVAANIQVEDDRTTFSGDTVVITVVDVGSPESLAFFWGCAPIGDPTLISQLEQVSRQIRVD